MKTSTIISAASQQWWKRYGFSQEICTGPCRVAGPVLGAGAAAMEPALQSLQRAAGEDQ